MKIDRLSYFLLKLFETTVITRSISETAKELYLTQPAVSNAIARLRDMFNDQLFIRKANKLVLTEKAEQMIPDIISILKSMEKLDSSDTYDPMRQPRHFRIGLTQITKHVIYARIINTFSQYPITLEFIPIDYYYPETATAYPDMDLLIGLVKPSDQLHNLFIHQSEIAVIGCSDNPILQKPDFSIDDYLTARHIVIHDIPNEYNPILSIIGTPDPRDIFVKMGEYSDFMNILAGQDYLITTTLELANIYKQRYHKELAIRLLPVPKPERTIDFYAAWSDMHHNHASNIWLREQLSQLTFELWKREIPKLDQKIKI